jgi:acyl-CoA synthetase (AMP-forming)/AMP-acid ligase II/acyl carrier protein
MRLPDKIRQVAQAWPEALAILAPGQEPLRYRQLEAMLTELSQTLQSLGLGVGARVAMVLPNGPEMVTAFLSTLTVASVAPLNPAYREAELEFFLSDLRAQAVILSDPLSPAHRAARGLGIPVIRVVPEPDGPAGTFRLDGMDGTVAGQTPLPDDLAEIALLLHTSGTTSRPKLVPLSHGNLLASAENVRRSLALTPADRCLNVMPLFHIHGLVAALSATLTSGGSLVCLPGFEPAAFFQALSEQRPTWYSAVPTIHQAVLAHAPATLEHHLRLIRSSSAALPPSVMNGLETVFGVPVLEAYGMTEAAHQICCNPLPPKTRKAGSVGLSAGPEVRILNPGPDGRGEVALRGANLTRGYDNNPEANQEAYQDGWFRTGDEGYLDSEGYLFLTGRLKEMINRGGEKIAPREIDEALLCHPAVAQALTFAVQHPTLGEDVAVAIVRKSAVEAEELRQFALGQLADFKVPSRFVFVDEIPRGATGKLQRIGLEARLAPLMEAPRVAPRTPTEQALCEIWRETLNVEAVHAASHFFHLGGDSLSATSALAHINARFGTDLRAEALFHTPVLSDFAALLEQSADRSRDMEALMAEIEALSDEEAMRLLEKP